MKYGKIVCGKFQKRLNRFIAEVIINDKLEKVHVKNTGRLKELLQPNVDVLLEESNNPNRKTKYSLIATRKENRWVNIDSQAPNVVAFEAIKKGKIHEIGTAQTVKKEVTFGSSRFDLYIEKEDEKGFIEVKGVTLEIDGLAKFPDAPTSRGTKHIYELIKAVKEGYKGTILFIIQMEGCYTFTPNKETDPAFSDALIEASKNGVKILAYDTVVNDEGEMIIGKPIPVELAKNNE